MTVICAMRDDTGLYVAADRQTSTATGRRNNVTYPKVFTKQGWTFGVAGQSTIGHIIRYTAELPEKPTNVTHRYVVSELVPALRQAVVDYQFEDDDSVILVAAGGRIFDVFVGNWSCHESTAPHLAVGSGDAVSEGVLWLCRKRKIPAAEAVRLAVEAACAVTFTCGGRPLVVEAQ